MALKIPLIAYRNVTKRQLKGAFNGLLYSQHWGFATMGKAANLALATRNAVTDLF